MIKQMKEIKRIKQSEERTKKRKITKEMEVCMFVCT
jgi:hypothetical protein